MNTKSKKWYDAMIAKGHTPIMCSYDSTQIESFVYEQGFCNGPGCSTCNWSTCWHCNKDENSIPECEKKL